MVVTNRGDRAKPFRRTHEHHTELLVDIVRYVNQKTSDDFNIFWKKAHLPNLC